MSDSIDTILSGSPFVIFKWKNDPLWTVEYVSPNIKTCFGYEPADFLTGRLQLSDLVHPEDARRVADEAREHDWQGLNIGEQEYRLRKQGGSFVWISDYTRILKDAEGAITHYVGYILEITRQKDAEALLAAKGRELEEKSRNLEESNARLENVQRELQSLNASLEERMDRALNEVREKDAILLRQSRHAALGEMIGNIAHQWRQPLNALAIMVQDMEEAYGFGELNETRIREIVSRSMLLINYLSSTIDDFRNFFRTEKEKQSFSIRDAINQSVELVEAALKSSAVELVRQEQEDVPVLGYRNEFAQALVNILSNARDAIIERKVQNGRIEISTESGAGYVSVVIRDNGGGIDPAILDKIFDPYFTTKHQAQGTGIGLYMTKTIIERHMQGNIAVRNVDGGAEFRITLPV